MTITKESKRILSVTIKRIPDYDADTSMLGEYSDDAGDFAIVAIGEYRGEFVSDLGCECGHSEADHSESEDYAIGEGGIKCNAMIAGSFNSKPCGCEDYDPIVIERGREYRYFNSASIESDNSDEDNRTYAMQDYDRMRTLGDDWNYLGITSEALVQLNGDLTQKIHSGGLWGIESDSDDSYFTEIEQEQLSELRDQLHAIGFSKRSITAAFRNVERKEE